MIEAFKAWRVWRRTLRALRREEQRLLDAWWRAHYAVTDAGTVFGAWSPEYDAAMQASRELHAEMTRVRGERERAERVGP